jgi:hypothetical protein
MNILSRQITILILIGTLLFSCSAKFRGMRFEPKEFKTVEVESGEIHEMSPEEPIPGWTGIVISVPEKAFYPGSKELPVFPICGYYSLAVSAIEERNEPMNICILNLDTDSLFQGYMIKRNPNPKVPRPTPEGYIPPPVNKNLKIGGYFNPNALIHVGLPLVSGKYEVYMEYGGYTSNKEQVEIIRFEE